MENTFTPGPWQVARKVSNYVVARDGLDIICQCDTMNEAKRSTEDANARLIAAAPDLLAALEQALKLVDAYRRVSGGDGDIAAMNARSAIAKATGDDNAR